MPEKTLGQLILEVLERVEEGQKVIVATLDKVLKALPADVDLDEPADPKSKPEKKGE